MLAAIATRGGGRAGLGMTWGWSGYPVQARPGRVETAVFCRVEVAKRGFLMKYFFSPLRKDSREVLKKTSALEKALIQKMIYEDLGRKFGGKWMRALLLQPKKSGEYVNSLVMYEMTAALAHSPEFKGASLKHGFGSWIRIVLLHLWLIDSRMRFLPDARLKKRLMTHILDYFWEDLELGLVDTLVTTNPMVITKYSKMYLNIWYGSALAYDVGAIRSDTSMAEAVWRNLYESDPNVPLSEIYKMVEYIRIQQHRLMEISDEKICNADWSWTKAPFEIPDTEKAKLLGPEGRQATLFHTHITASPKLSEHLRKQQEAIKQELQDSKKQEQKK